MNGQSNSQKIIATILVVMALYVGKSIFIPFFLSLFLAILFDPFVQRLGRINIPRKISASLVVILFLLCTASFSWFLYAYARNFTHEIPAYSERIQSFSTRLSQKFEQLENTTRLTAMSSKQEKEMPKVQVVEASGDKWEHNILNWMGSVMEFLNIIIFVPLLLLYFLIDKENILESFYTIIGRYFYLPKLNSDLPKMIRTFFKGNLVAGLALAITQSVILWFFGYKNYLALGVITGILNLFPLIGALLALIPIFIEGMMQFTIYYPIFLAAGAILVLHALANNILVPIMVGGRVNVNSGALILGFLFWGWIWGGLGFVLAIPLTAFLKIFLDCNHDCAPLANLLAARPKYIMYFGRRTHPYK